MTSKQLCFEPEDVNLSNFFKLMKNSIYPTFDALKNAFLNYVRNNYQNTV